MRKILILLAIIFTGMVSNAQDTTITFIDETIPFHIEVDTVLLETDFIIIDTIDIGMEPVQDSKLMPWFVRDSVNINAQKFALRHVQRKFEKYETTKVVRSYRYRNVRYIRVPETIKKKIVQGE